MENKMDIGKEIAKIAKSVKQDSYSWVLILGTGISYDGMKAAETEISNQILQLQHGGARQDGMRKRVCKAVQERNHDAVMTALYGDIWNGVSFLRSEEEEQKKRRERYAEKFAVRKNINLECYKKLDMCSLIKTFQGIILTTCQDEIIEAFLEDELCMTVKNQIYTPYSLATLTHWKKRLERSRALIKLHGTCTEPCRMLLSKNDMNMYYPEKEQELHTVEALDWIFQNKNLLFIGMDLEDDRENPKGKPVLAPGIQRLLEKDIPACKNKKKALQRYIILEKGEGQKVDQDLYEKFHIETLICPAKDMSDLIKCLTGQTECTVEEETADLTKVHENQDMVRMADGEKTGVLTKEEAEEIFWDNYNRRPKHHISRREMHILEKHILEKYILSDQKNADSVDHIKANVKKLAMAANNFAEFKDLWKALDMTEAEDKTGHKDENGKSCQPDMGQIIDKILNGRIDDRSRQLHQILKFYGQGFPMGFLNLITEDEKELELWKRAGIQLTNSGIYIQSNDRKMIYEQVEYADQLVQYAGENPHKEEFRCRIRENEQQVADSYFYPIGEEIIEIEEIQIEEMEEKYKGIFDRMIEILKKKNKEYSHLRSLLETELPTIVKVINNLDGYEKKPELLYYLLRECQMQAKDSEELLEMVKRLQKGIPEDLGNEVTVCKKLMLYQVQAIVESSQREEHRQKDAIKSCIQAEEMIQQYKQKLHIDEMALLRESVFIQLVQIYLLKGKIYGRLSSIKEIERCHYADKDSDVYYNIRKAQKKYLRNMIHNLHKAEHLKEKRSEKTGGGYEALGAEIEHLSGESCFKKSQYINENIRYSDKDICEKKKDIQELEGKYYSAAEGHYKNALKIYQNYPDQYRLQEAGVLRNIADLYGRMGKTGTYFEQQVKKEYNDKCYKYLQDAYIYYRSYNNLHGIADVLQSMGEMEDYDKKPEEGRKSGICFYRASAKLYRDLGDEWSHYVVSAFEEEARKSMEQSEKKREIKIEAKYSWQIKFAIV